MNTIKEQYDEYNYRAISYEYNYRATCDEYNYRAILYEQYISRVI